MAGEKTEKATPKRKQDERKKGNVFLSQEVVTVATLLASFYALKFLAGTVMESLREFLQSTIALGASLDMLNLTETRQLWLHCTLEFAKIVLPILLATALAAVVSTMLQTRMLVSWQSVGFKGERINPLNGFKKMFSLRALVELLKSILKIVLLAVVLYNVLTDQLFQLPQLMNLSAESILSTSGQLISDIVLTVGMAFLFLAAADYLYQWWQYEKNLRMTKQEVKDEYKQMEGDPQIKGRQRSIQQQRAKRRMMQAVPSADVVIRNPTHFAVALRYDREKDRAPIVVAKGQDRIALKIVEIAEKNGVHVMEDRPLARALFHSIEIGQEIPAQFYEPVAQILAFVYNLKKKDTIT